MLTDDSNELVVAVSVVQRNCRGNSLFVVWPLPPLGWFVVLVLGMVILLLNVILLIWVLMLGVVSGLRILLR